MKKFVSPIPNGGAPLNGERLNDVLGLELWSSIEGILNAISNPAASGNVGVIVSGCVVTLHGGGPNYDMTSGIVYLNGEFMKHPGFSNVALPRYIVPATVINTNKVFNDGIARTLIVEKDATDQSGVPGSGQYISLTTTGNFGVPGGVTIDNFLLKPKTWNLFTLLNSWTNTAGNARWRYNGSLIEIWFHVTAPAVGSTTSQIAAIPSFWNLDDSTRQKRFQALCTNTGARANLYWVGVDSGNLFIFSGDGSTNIAAGDHIEATILLSPN